MKKQSILSLCFALSLPMVSTHTWAARLEPSDLNYLGAFLLPTTTLFAAQAEGSYPNTTGMALNPDGNNGAGSIFIIGRGGRVSEINIPDPKMSGLTYATVLQSNMTAITGYDKGGMGNDATSGIAYMTARGSQSSPKLYYGSYIYYNTVGTDYNSLGWAETTLSNTNPKGLWHVGPRVTNNDLTAWNHGVKSGGYLLTTPQAWADKYTQGRSLLIGRTREAAGAGGSSGPVLIATAPWESGNPPAPGTELPATPLMYFYTNVSLPKGNSKNWQAWRMFNDPDWTYWSPMDRTTGGAWVERDGKRALILAIRHGIFKNDPVNPAFGSDGSHGGFVADPEGNTPPYCYGEKTQCPNALSEVKGYHAEPYVARLAFVDIGDLESVATGLKDPRTVTAYNVYNLMSDFGTPVGTQKDRNNSHDIVGVVYNEKTGRLYVGQTNGNDPNGFPNAAWPVVHVYQVNDDTLVNRTSSAVNSSDSSSTSNLGPPSGLKIIP